MRLCDVLSTVVLFLHISVVQVAGFSCYKCITVLGEDEKCLDIDDSCPHDQCAKIKYKDNNKIKIIRECSPVEDVVQDEICHKVDILKGKPCDAWLCNEPLCNGAEAAVTRATGANAAASSPKTLLSTLAVILSYLYTVRLL